MTDHLDEIKTTPLQAAYREGRRKAGKAAVHSVLVAHGAASGVLEDVPAAKRDACLAALRKLTRESGADANAKSSGGFARPTSPSALDPEAIYARWNAQKARTTDLSD